MFVLIIKITRSVKLLLEVGYTGITYPDKLNLVIFAYGFFVFRHISKFVSSQVSPNMTLVSKVVKRDSKISLSLR